MILVDTSVWIDYFNGYPPAEADLLTLGIAEARAVVLAGLVLTETLQGVRDADRAERVRRVLSAFELAPSLRDPTTSRLPLSTARVVPAGQPRGQPSIASSRNCVCATVTSF
jgi:predicted nucleic acid-binding protein